MINRIIKFIIFCYIISVASAQTKSVKWTINNHTYHYFSRIGYYSDAVTACQNMNPKSYLVTVTSYAEWEFIMNTFQLKNRLWISGQDIGKGEWTYSTGPETNAKMYSVSGDRTNTFINWCTGEPGVGGGETAIEYTNGQYCFNNNNPGNVRIEYICETNEDTYEPFLQPTPVPGGIATVFKSTDNFPINFDYSKIKISLSKLSGGPSFQCASPKENTNNVTCIMPPGELGFYNVYFSDGVYNLSSLYQYQPAYIATIFPKNLARRNQITLTGTGFGSDPTNIKIAINSKPCTNVGIVKSGTAISCNLTADVTSGLFPISVSVNGVNSSSVKAPMYFEGEGSFYSCFYTKSNIANSITYASSQVSEGMVGELGVITSASLASFLEKGCGWAYATGGYPSILSDLWMNAMYNSANSRFEYLTGSKAGQLVNIYNPNDLAPSSNTNLQYDMSSAYLSSAGTTGSTLTVFTPTVKQPIILGNQNFTISTSGQIILIKASQIGTTFSNCELTLDNGGVYPNNYIDFDNNIVGFMFPPGINGPFSAVIKQSSLTSTGGTIFIDYYAPMIEYTNSPTTDGTGLIVQGWNFTKTIENIKIQFLIDNVWTVGQNLSIEQDYNRFRCDAPAFYGNVSARVFIGEKQSQLYNISYQTPVIDSMTNVTAAGGLVTVSGSNFYNTPNLLNVTVGSAKCTNITFVTTHTQFTCNLGPGNQSYQAKVKIGNTVNNDNQVPYTFSYLAPIVTNATSIRYLVGGKVTVTGSNFANYILTVSIHGQACDNPLSNANGSSLVCQFNGTVVSNSPDFLNVRVGVNGLYGNAQVFKYDFPLCENNCSNHGVCIDGQCKCDEGWELYTNCSAPSVPGGEPNPGNNGTGTLPGKGFNFTSAITHLREMNEFGDALVETTIPLAATNWTLLPISNATHRFLEGTFGNKTEVIINVNVTLYREKTSVVFAGQTIDIPKNTLKYVVGVRKWSFKSTLNSLQIIFSATVDRFTSSGCSEFETSATNHYNEFQVISGDSVLQAKFANGLIIDDRIMVANVRPLTATDPLMVDAFKNATVFTQMTAVVTPAFDRNCVVDPSFRTLINAKDRPCAKNDSNWRLITIVVLCVVGGCAIIVATVLLIKQNLKKKKYQQEMKLKQLQYSQNNL